MLYFATLGVLPSIFIVTNFVISAALVELCALLIGILFFFLHFMMKILLHCFDTVGWVTGRV